MNGRLEEELLAVKHLSVLLHTRDSDSLLAIGTRSGPLLGDTAGLDMGTGTSPSEETGHTSTSSSKSLGNGTLGTELDFDFTGKVSILEALVGTEIGQDHFLDLFRGDKGSCRGRCVISVLSFYVIQSAAQTSSNAAFLLAPRKKQVLKAVTYRDRRYQRYQRCWRRQSSPSSHSPS